MQPSKLSIAELFQTREQYLIPLFQRGYVWTLDKQVQPLWEDIVDRVDALAQHRAYAKAIPEDKLRSLRKHFLGAIIVGSAVSGDSERVATREVIDGQQRTTTLQLLLLALRDVTKGMEDEGLTYDIRQLTHNAGTYKAKSDQLKVWPTNEGRDLMEELAKLGSREAVCERFPAKGPSKEVIERPLMVQTYLFLSAMLEGLVRGKRHDDPLDESATSDDAQIFSRAVIRSIGKDNAVKVPFLDKPTDVAPARLLVDALQSCFQIMRLQLDDEDDPQIIFESLNARGEPLTPSDLIRNFVFLRAARQQENPVELYDAYWRAFDETPDVGAAPKGAKFWRREQRQGRLKNTRLDLLLFHYVTLRKHESIKVNHVFQEFKNWWEDGEKRQTAKELERLVKLAGHFATFVAPGQKTHFDLFCRRMQLLDTSTPMPLLMHFLEAHKPESTAFKQVMADIESYVVRRFVCGYTTKGYNRVFVERLLSEMVRDKCYDPTVLRDKLLSMSGLSQVWPNDQTFSAAWRTHRLYQGSSTLRVRALLEGLEAGLRTARQEFLPELTELQVEHVMPQKWKPTDYPIREDSAESLERRERLVHSIGNLTLVTPSFNKELSNQGFALKRPEIAANSSLVLNAYFQRFTDGDTWDEDAIATRADVLLPTALKVWAYPDSAD